jgi:ABC-2 type transport system permease protein
MAFISGAFFSTHEMPRFLEAISEVLPLTYLLDVIRSTFVNGEGLGSSGGALAAVGVWGVFGLVIAVRMFRWEPREGMTGA